MELIQTYFTDLSPKQLEQLNALKPLYEDWNSKINVISRKDMDSFYLHHVLHSLCIAAIFDFKPGNRIMDLGCGGGFPGLPLAIFFPDAHFHLVDSIQKKLKVVDAVAAEIGLENISTAHTRAEDIKNQQFDTVVSRAVAPLKDLWHWSRPLIQRNQSTPGMNVPNGLICLKGGDLTTEIHESLTRPRVWQVDAIFPQPYFAEKFMLYVQK